MTRDGEWFALPMPERLTVARESSSSQGLPTPRAGSAMNTPLDTVHRIVQNRLDSGKKSDFFRLEETIAHSLGIDLDLPSISGKAS
jgi:hypothetical protein